MRFMCMYKLCGVVLGQNELLVDIYCIIIIEAIIHQTKNFLKKVL